MKTQLTSYLAEFAKEGKVCSYMLKFLFSSLFRIFLQLCSYIFFDICFWDILQTVTKEDIQSFFRTLQDKKNKDSGNIPHFCR